MSEKDKKVFAKRNYYSAEDTGLGFLLAVMAPLIVMLLFLIVQSLLINLGVAKDQVDSSMKIIQYFISPIAFCTLFFLFNKFRKISFSAAKVNFKLGIVNTVICFAVPLICVFGMSYFVTGIDNVLIGWGYSLSSISIPLDNAGYLILAILLIGLLPAVFEELVFRGIILNGLRKSLSDVDAIFMSAFLFAIMHGNLQQLLYPFALGLVLGWIAIRMKSTFASMLVHFLNNSIVIITNYISLKNNYSVPTSFSPGQWAFSAFLVLLAAGGILAIEWFYFKRKNQVEKNVSAAVEVESQIDAPQTKQKLPFLLWVGIIFAIIIFIINTVLGFTNVGA